MVLRRTPLISFSSSLRFTNDSVERNCIDKLPLVAEDFHRTDTVIKVGDSRPGWAKALRELIAMLYVGQVPTWDISQVRPAGARLKTFGGRASGPEPLESLFNFAVNIFQNAQSPNILRRYA